MNLPKHPLTSSVAAADVLLARRRRQNRTQRRHHMPACLAVVSTMVAAFLLVSRPTTVQAFAPSITPTIVTGPGAAPGISGLGLHFQQPSMSMSASASPAIVKEALGRGDLRINIAASSTRLFGMPPSVADSRLGGQGGHDERNIADRMTNDKSHRRWKDSADSNEMDNNEQRRQQNEQAMRQRREWIDRSIDYYSKVMREERRRNMGQTTAMERDADAFLQLAKKHYFALYKIRSGKHSQAEAIYRRIIGELLAEAEEEGGESECDHANLAVTTLLLALHLQRSNRIVETRSVFLMFFRRVFDSDHPCACSAKVLGAYALFEMKQGHASKSLCIAEKAVALDPSLAPILRWKQFREVMASRGRRGRRGRREGHAIVQ